MKKTETTTTIKGVPLTERMLEELQEWELGMTGDNEPRTLIRNLSEIQDFLCEQFSGISMLETEFKRITILINYIMDMKKTLAPFAEYVKDDEK